jgi:hypothetical protein
MGELSAALDELLRRIQAQVREMQVQSGQKRVKANNHVITYTSHGTSAQLECREQTEYPITIHLSEQPERSMFTYTFPLERHQEVRAYFSKAGALGAFILRQIAGCDPRYGSTKTISTALPTKAPFKEMPELLEQHILKE